MLIAHLPAGYLLARGVGARAGRDSRPLFLAALVGSVFPDLDMLWFHLVDHGGRHHHTYWTHTPWCWAALVALLAGGAAAIRRPRAARIALSFGAGVLLHLLLDTFVGDIRWLAPFDDRFVSLFTVPARPGRHWILSFALHWSFLVELALLAAGSWSWARRRSILGP